MVALKLFLFAVLLFPIFAGIGVDSDASIPNGDELKGDARVDSSLLEQLKSKIRSLERQVEEKTQELKDKDTTIADKEKIIQEKLDRIVSLEKQVEQLHVKIKETEQLEAQVDNLQKIIDEQEQALKLAEEEIMKAKGKATSNTKELIKLHEAWLPPWLAVYVARGQSHVEQHWEVHGKPIVQRLTQKAMEKKTHVEEWAAPHVETIKVKLAPIIKKQWVVIEPHVQTITTKTVEMYQTSKKTISPHVVKVVETITPYFQEVRKVSEPYINRIVDATRPHVDSLHTALKPYTQPAVFTCGKFLESATTYHHHIQERVQEKLDGHELTKPFATKELVWFTASALLALPILFLMRICSFTSRHP
ncbi:uncharacterized protein LOC127243176 [Andrographis paniculata]|uniref:uncharacterized protein LOC127243176 n=1 Tax=Andrographis paniculata TaxID=175694 RepID=UPI0021E84AB4|nr:uncharacterized protein LOC127243176 [Andrographis paniculata]